MRNYHFYSLNYSDYCYNAIHRQNTSTVFFGILQLSAIFSNLKISRRSLYRESCFHFAMPRNIFPNQVFLLMFPLVFHSTTQCYWHCLNRGFHYGYMWPFPNIEVIFICSHRNWKTWQSISPLSIPPPWINRPCVFYNFSEKVQIYVRLVSLI